MYRFAMGQMRLARQQQDFVSAVSHELKTPLTSIRMYGEMLKAGWADEAKKRTYYEYIHSESERLSRLIDNVLQLARLTRSSQHFDMKRSTVAELMDMVRSKVSTQVERAGFALTTTNTAPADAEVLMDPDCFAQIVINLVDNALKFSVGAERKVVEIACRRESDGRLLFTVRDFGPGIPKGSNEEDLRAVLSARERAHARNRRDRHRACPGARAHDGDERPRRRAQLRARSRIPLVVRGRAARMTATRVGAAVLPTVLAGSRTAAGGT